MKNKRLAQYGLFIALAFIFGYIESLIPIPIKVSGMKLGLANIITMIVLYKIDIKAAAIVTLLRVILLAFTFGNPYSMLYSLCGAAVSLGTMALLRKLQFHLITVSIMGAVMHNVGQILVAVFIVHTVDLFYLLPLLGISGIVSGFIMGSLAAIMLKRMKKIE